jgi:hypothetical protein
MMKEIHNIQKQHPQHSKNNTRKPQTSRSTLQHYNMEKIMVQHDEGNSQHSQHSKNNTRNHRDLLLQHYNMEKIMAQHQLMLRATWSRIPQHSKTTSATFKNNICNTDI